jgi:hypothetical protein
MAKFSRKIAARELNAAIFRNPCRTARRGISFIDSCMKVMELINVASCRACKDALILPLG